MRAGFVGIGRIGGAMLQAVIDAGIEVVVFDVAPDAVRPFADQPGVTVAASARQVGAEADVIDVVVNTDRHVLEACLGDDGILAGCRPGTVVLIHSTISLETLRTVAAAGAADDVHVLDAPISGRWGHFSALSGELCVMVGGDEDAYRVAEPVLRSYGGLVRHLGPLGSGLDAKLALNVIRYASLLAARDAGRLLAATGTSVPLAELVRYTGASGNWDGVMPPLAFRGSDPGDLDRLRNNAATARKDLRAAVARAAEMGVELPTSQALIGTVHSMWDVPYEEDEV